MNKIIHSTCPLCGSSNIEKQFSCKDHFATGELFDIYKCNECSFAFTQGVPDEKEIGRYYESPTYISHSDTNKGVINKLYHIVRSIMLRRKVNLIKSLTMLRRGSILDYGAGIGYFAKAMQKAGWDVTAIEKSSQARDFAKKNLGVEMLPEEQFPTIEDSVFD
ncbi:MAG: methyltransferase, partial [Bacteroidaceae bacterium]|nr:methyltransferase [Bacteroidaceae bacterium]